MKRRLIKQAKNTLTISLPQQWTQKNKLEAGDELDVFEKETTLILSAEKKSGEYNFELDIETDNQWYIGQILRYCYFANFEKTRLFFHTKKTMDVIREETQKLIGLEIMEQEKNYCVIKNISFEMEEEYPTLFRKVFLLISQLFEALHTENLREMQALHRDCLRFSLFCRRVIIKHYDSLQKMNEYILLQRLTMIANNLQYLAEVLVEEKRKLTSVEKNSLTFCAEMYVMFYHTYYNSEQNKLLQLNQKRKEFVKLIDNQKTSAILYYLWEIVRILGSSGSLILYKGLRSKV